MKTLFKSALLCAVALLAAIAFTACDDKDKDKDAPATLTGTKWKYTNQDGTWTQIGILTFQTATTGILEIDEADSSDGYTDSWDITFTYTYSAPDIYIVDEDETELAGTVNGNKMTLTDEDGESIVLTKQ